MRLRRTLITFLALVTTIVSVAACGGSSSSSSSSGPTGSGSSASGTAAASSIPSGTSLSVGQNAYALSPSVVAAGNDDPSNYNLKFVNFEAAPAGIAALLGGSVDLVQASAVGTLAAQSAGDPIKVVSAAYQAPAQYQLLVPDDSPIHSVSQLKGKSIAVFKASAGEGFLIAALKKAGLTEKDVHVINLAPPAAQAAFGKGSYDAWAIWEPFVSLAKLKLHARVLTDAENAWKPLVFLVTSTKDLADPAKVAAMKAFVHTYQQSTDFSGKNLTAYGDAYAKATGLPTSVALKAVPNGTIKVVPVNSAITNNYQQQVKLFVSGGLFPSAPSNITSVFDPVLNSALSSK
jgi:sulfonate transport system substrate-binding protein